MITRYHSYLARAKWRKLRAARQANYETFHNFMSSAKISNLLLLLSPGTRNALRLTANSGDGLDLPRFDGHQKG
jgi:hypothetical protein